MQLDVWLKRIWLLIGCLVLFIALAGAVIFVLQLFTGHNYGGPLVGANAHPQGPDSLVMQDLTFDFPQPLGRTGWLNIGVYVRDLSSPTPETASHLSKYSEVYSRRQGMVNILFLKRDGSEAHPLLESRALIKTTDIPNESDSLQRFNLYDISFRDSDRNGRITPKDSSQLFISDLNGDRLAPLIDNSHVLVTYEKSRDRKLIYLLLKERVNLPEVKPENWPERLYVFDVGSRSMSSLPKDGQVLERMRRTLLNN